MNELRPRLPTTVPQVEPAPVVSPGPPSPSRIFFALGSLERYEMMRLLADGQPRPVREIASAVRRKFNGVSKHLAILRSAGLLESCTPEGADARTSWYQLPAAFRATPGVLDFGCCTVRL